MQNHLVFCLKNQVLNPKHAKFDPNSDFGHVLCVFRPDSGGRPQSEFGRIRTAVPNLSSDTDHHSTALKRNYSVFCFSVLLLGLLVYLLGYRVYFKVFLILYLSF